MFTKKTTPSFDPLSLDLESLLGDLMKADVAIQNREDKIIDKIEAVYNENNAKAEEYIKLCGEILEYTSACIKEINDNLYEIGKERLEKHRELDALMQQRQQYRREAQQILEHVHIPDASQEHLKEMVKCKLSLFVDADEGCEALAQEIAAIEAREQTLLEKRAYYVRRSHQADWLLHEFNAAGIRYRSSNNVTRIQGIPFPLTFDETVNGVAARKERVEALWLELNKKAL